MGLSDNKVAVVTGGASGIGAAIVKELAAGGVRVVVADRDPSASDRIVAEVSAAGGTASPFTIDVSSAEQNVAMVCPPSAPVSQI